MEKKENTIGTINIPPNIPNKSSVKRKTLNIAKISCNQKTAKKIKMTLIQKSTRLARFVLSCIKPPCKI